MEDSPILVPVCFLIDRTDRRISEKGTEKWENIIKM